MTARGCTSGPLLTEHATHQRVISVLCARVLATGSSRGTLLSMQTIGTQLKHVQPALPNRSLVALALAWSSTPSSQGSAKILTGIALVMTLCCRANTCIDGARMAAIRRASEARRRSSRRIMRGVRQAKKQVTNFVVTR